VVVALAVVVEEATAVLVAEAEEAPEVVVVVELSRTTQLSRRPLTTIRVFVRRRKSTNSSDSNETHLQQTHAEVQRSSRAIFEATATTRELVSVARTKEIEIRRPE
jgi:hypothetical protein